MANHNHPTNGFDKRREHINRKGRPRNFDALRELAQQIGHEAVTVKDSDKRMTVTEIILRQWAQSKNPQLQRAFIEIAFGKVPDKVSIDSNNIHVLKVEYVNDWRTHTTIPASGTEESTE